MIKGLQTNHFNGRNFKLGNLKVLNKMYSRLYNIRLSFVLGTLIVDIPCFAAREGDFKLHLVVEPVNVLAVVGDFLLWSNGLLNVRGQVGELKT